MKYGPGKFEACGNYSHVAQWLYNNADEDLGDCETFGYFGKFSGKIKGHGPFYAITSEDSNGFVTVDYYDTEKQLDKAWNKLEREYTHAQGPDFADDDVKLDHIPDVRECRALIRKFKAQNFYPNVWHVNDHGNVDLLAIGYNGAHIVDSWV